MTTRPSESPNRIARWVRRLLWQPSEKYFLLPETYAEQPEPEGENPFGRSLTTLGDRFYDWTGGTHPTPRFYVAVGAVLAIMTGMELWAFRWPFERVYINSALLALSTAKFVIVVGFFMHLKFDAPLFRKVFGAGLLLAIAIALSLLALFFKLNG